MKKINLLCLLSGLLLGACANETTYVPRVGGKADPISFELVNPTSTDPVTPEEEEDLPNVYEFYFDFIHTEEPIFTCAGSMLKPLGLIPTEVDSKEKVLALATAKGYKIDPLFNEYLGFSYYGVALDETNIWDFENDYKQQATIALYGIWVSK